MIKTPMIKTPIFEVHSTNAITVSYRIPLCMLWIRMLFNYQGKTGDRFRLLIYKRPGKGRVGIELKNFGVWRVKDGPKDWKALSHSTGAWIRRKGIINESKRTTVYVQLDKVK